MESRNHQNDVRAAAASKLNEDLANQVARWKRARLAAAILLAAVGIGAFFVKAVAVFSVPCLLGALIACLLYLDARDQLREVKLRNWVSATPRFSKISETQHKRALDAPTSH